MVSVYSNRAFKTSQLSQIPLLLSLCLWKPITAQMNTTDLWMDFVSTDDNVPATCNAGGVSEDDECYFGEDNSYETMSCFQYLNGNDCGNEYPGDNAAGDCDDSSQRYRICNTPENGTDACAQMNINTVEDCAVTVAQLIVDGVCDASGMFYSSLCLDDPERPSCVCHYAGSVMGDYTDTGHGNSVYMISGDIDTSPAIPTTCALGGVPRDDECYFGDDNKYETMSCFQYLNGNDCGNEYPGDNAAGICNATSQRYRICNTPEGGDDACAQMNINTVEDCALAVHQLIADGVCDESGMFYSSLCQDDPERPSCVCHYAGSVMGDYTNTGHGNSVYRLLNDTVIPAWPATCSAGDISRDDEDDQCYFDDDNSYETMSCFQYLNGEDCGNEYPGDNAAGKCDDTSQRYRICNTPEGGDDACAQMDIFTVEDCALAVGQLIADGVCDESGMFYSSLCQDAPERPSCVCHYAGSVMGDYTDTDHGNSVYMLLNDTMFTPSPTSHGHHDHGIDDDAVIALAIGCFIGLPLLIFLVCYFGGDKLKSISTGGTSTASGPSHESAVSHSVNL